MSDDTFTGSAEQFQALHLALQEIDANKSLTINGLLTDIARVTKSQLCTPATIYRFIKKEEVDATLKYDIAAPLYSFLRTSVKYRTSNLSVFHLGKQSVEHSLFYELRSFFSKLDSGLDITKEITSYNAYLSGRYASFRRPWMLPEKIRNSYVLVTEFSFCAVAGDNALVVSEEQKYDGIYGGMSPIREKDIGYAIGFGRSLLIIMKSTRGATASFYFTSEIFPEFASDAKASIIRGTMVSNKGPLPYSSSNFVARRIDSDLETGVLLEKDLRSDPRFSDLIDYI